MEESKNQQLPFVVGAGLGRTGTLSFKKAMELLGYKTFHMTENFEGRADSDSWFNLAATSRLHGEKNKDLAIETSKLVLQQGYNATTDFPACLLYQEFLQLQPNTKVILSVRKNPQVWSKSVLDSIGQIGNTVAKLPFSLSPTFSRFSSDLIPFLWEEIGVAPLGTFDYGAPLREDMKQELEAAYTAWIQRVKETVPADQLLIHEPSHGFGPICRHLGILDSECPAKYPHVNSKEEFQQMVRWFNSMRFLFWSVVAILVLLALGVKVRVARKRKSPGFKKSE